MKITVVGIGVWALVALGCSGGGAAPTADAAMGPDSAAIDSAAADAAATDVLAATMDAGGATTDVGAPEDGALIRGVRADRPSACPYRSPVTDTYSWAPPRAQRGACTTQQIDALRREIVDNGYGESTLRGLVGDGCFTCVFSNPETDSAWGPMLVPTPSNPLPYLNVGGCSVLVGATLGCGRASLRYQRCAYAACDGCEAQDVDTCVNDPQLFASGGACASARAAYLLSCQNTQGIYARCWGPDGISYEDWMGLVFTEFCGPAPDGGP